MKGKGDEETTSDAASGKAGATTGSASSEPAPGGVKRKGEALEGGLGGAKKPKPAPSKWLKDKKTGYLYDKATQYYFDPKTKVPAQSASYRIDPAA